MAEKANLNTAGYFIAQLQAFRGEVDDASQDEFVVVEVVDTEDEIEIAWDDRKERKYLRFRMKDFQRAVKERT